MAAGRDASGRFALVRYRPDGSLDGSFGDGGIVGTPSDGKLVAGGSASDNPNHGEFAAARYFGR